MYNLNVTSTVLEDINLPPTSAQSFIREDKQFPALILNSAEKTNKFYHSIYDDAENIQFIYRNTSKDFDVLDNVSDSKIEPNSIQMRIRNVASLLGMSLYEILLKQEYKDDQLAGSILLDEFFYCYLNTSDCRLFEATMKLDAFHGNKWPPNR